MINDEKGKNNISFSSLKKEISFNCALLNILLFLLFSSLNNTFLVPLISFKNCSQIVLSKEND